MKKMIVIFLIILCSCGIAYVGYLIFKSKNIDTVELVGQIQTVYVVGDEIDYEDAQLKVTYKNGNIKMIDLDSKSVDIEYFSTSVETHGKMNILYKSAVIEVEYNVLRKGAYYLNSLKINTLNESQSLVTSSNSYDIGTTTEMLYIENNGILSHYVRGTAGWCMSDGNYNKNYSYTIVGDTMNIELNDDSYEIKVNYLENGKMSLVSNKLTTVNDSSLVVREENKTFEYTAEMKTNQTVAAGGVDMIGFIDSESDVVQFVVGDKLDTMNPKAYIKVTYAQYNIGHQFREVYVTVADSMINGSYSTEETRSLFEAASVQIVYNGQKDTMFYYVTAE